MNREQTLDSLRQRPDLSVLIVGAGINGIGTFRDLALQGVDVLVVDRGDFCSGASMASSHMLHGGIRYLENGEFRLVREALHERNNLLRNAPHLAAPLPTTIPIFRWFSGLLNAPLKFAGLLDKPSERGALVIKIGLLLYDAYVRGDSPMPRHGFLNRAKSREKWPALNPAVRFTATYYDGKMLSPERLAMEILLDGEAEHNRALALNYVSAVSAEGETVTLRDKITGEEFTVRPKVVVNAAGPWIDTVNRQIDGETHFIGGTKGSHLIVDHPALREAIGDHEFFFEYVDGRIVLIYPYGDKVLLGTTDIRVDDADSARCTGEEVEYILGMVPRVFPDLTVTPEQIVFRFAGVRPLPPASGRTGTISRDHSIETVEPDASGLAFPILSLVGGKWTTYRAFAEVSTDTALERLAISRRASTAAQPIGGGRDYPADEAARRAWITKSAGVLGLPEDRVAGLFERYGTRAAEVAAFIARGQDAPLVHLPTYSRREIAYLAIHERVVHLDDLVLRRSLIAWLGDLTPALAEELADVVGHSLGWSTEQRGEEVTRLRAIMEDRHGVVV